MTTHGTRKVVENSADFIRLITRWKDIEEEAALQMGETASRTGNPFIQAVMRTIQRDALNHKDILELVLDSVVRKPVTLTLEDLSAVWEAVETHIEKEKEVIEMAERAFHESRHFILRHLLAYLVEDEQKHLKLLTRLEDFKRRIYPSL